MQVRTPEETAGTAEQLELPLQADLDSAKVAWLHEQLDLVPADDFASALGIAEQTLAGWRCNKQGPAFVKLGKTVFYRREDLKIWIASCRQEPAAA